jgi:hypothetical protein
MPSFTTKLLIHAAAQAQRAADYIQSAHTRPEIFSAPASYAGAPSPYVITA